MVVFFLLCYRTEGIVELLMVVPGDNCSITYQLGPRSALQRVSTSFKARSFHRGLTGGARNMRFVGCILII